MNKIIRFFACLTATLFIVFCFPLVLPAQTYGLADANNRFTNSISMDSLEVSLLTCAPGFEVYALYGHTAIRVRNLKRGDDFVFNYGTFNMSEPYFVPKFMVGIMNYELGGAYYLDFARRYAYQGMEVTHQVLNLTPEEKASLLNKLLENYLPQNRGYSYNFIYDNCSTRPRDMIEAAVKGRLIYQGDSLPTTYRRMLHGFNERWPWSKLGVDLCLGAEADRPLTLRQQEFLPTYLMHHYQQTMIKDAQGQLRPLVQREFVVPADRPLDDTKEFFLSPMQCACLLLALVLLLSIWEIRKKRLLWGLDLVLFLAQGVTGLIVAILFFFSAHPTVGSNWLLWLFNPIPLFYLPLLIYKGVKRQKDVYHIANAVSLTLFILFCKLIPQDIPIVVVPLALILLVRSVNHILLCKK